MRSLFRLLIPNRTDRLLWAWSLLYAAAASSIVSVYLLGPFRELRDAYAVFVPQFAVAGAVFGGMGLWRWSILRRRWPWVLAALGSLGVFPLLSQLIHLNLASEYYRALANRGDIDPQSFVRTSTQYLGLWCLVTFLVTRTANWVTTLIVNRLARLKIARTRLLLAVALVLFGMSVLTRSGSSSSFVSDLIRNSIFGQSVVGVVVLTLLSISVVAILLMRMRPWWLSLVFGFGYMGLLAWSIAMGLIATGTTLSSKVGVSIAVYLGLIATTCLLMRQPEIVSGNESPETETDAGRSRIGRRHTLAAPSIWGLTSVALVGLFIFGAVRYDPLAWWNAPPGRRWEFARLSRQFQTIPGTTGFVLLDTSTPFGGPNKNLLQVHLRFSDDTPADAFSRVKIPDDLNIWLSINQMRPEIDVSPVSRTKRMVTISSGTISPDQFAELLSGENSFYDYLDSVEVIAEPATRSISELGTVYFSSLPAGSIANLFKTVEQGKNRGDLRVMFCDLNMNDWSEIVRVSQFHSVTVQEVKLTDEIVEYLDSHPAGNLVLSSRDITMDDPEFWKLILDSEVGIWFSGGPWPGSRGGNFDTNSEEGRRAWQQYWDAVFASRGTSRFGHNVAARATPFERMPLSVFRQRCIDWHFCFDPPETRSPDNIRHLFVPPDEVEALARAGMIPELEVLSLDHEWLASLSNRAIVGTGFAGAVNWHEPTDLGFLKKTANIRELYVGMNQPILDFRFLAKLPKLRHLQVAAFDNAFQSFNPKDAPQLESVVLFAEPDFRLIRKFLLLPKLKSLVLVYSEEESELDEIMEKVDSALPEGVEFKTMKRDEYKTRVPELFQQHLERIREEARGKYLGDEADKSDGRD